MHMGCGQDVEELGERGLVEESPQHASYAQVDDDTPAGYLDFYSGAAVIQEVEELGRFVPEPTKTWTRVRVPQELVTQAETRHRCSSETSPRSAKYALRSPRSTGALWLMPGAPPRPGLAAGHASAGDAQTVRRARDRAKHPIHSETV
jgi:hypothetical protein